jgi:hypothetical protein
VPLISPLYTYSLSMSNTWWQGILFQSHRQSQPLFSALNILWQIDPAMIIIGFAGATGPREPSDRLFIFDPKTNDWHEGNRMPQPRAALTADFINGLLYAVGGVNSSHIPVATNEVYDPTSNSWSETAPMPTA